MAITYRSSQGSNNAGGGTTIVMTLPTGVADGDDLLMTITVVGGTGTSITTPSGWSLLDKSNSTTALTQALYWKTAASEPASYTVTITSNKASGIITAISGGATTLRSRRIGRGSKCLISELHGPQHGQLCRRKLDIHGWLFRRNCGRDNMVIRHVRCRVATGFAVGLDWWWDWVANDLCRGA